MIESPYAKVKNGKITKEIVYLNALEEEGYNIAHGATPYDSDSGDMLENKVEVRRDGKPQLVLKKEVDFIDVSPNQPFSVATSTIPFLEHNDANRALMGSNMQKQAVPCIVPEAPLVATGIEEKLARDTGRVIIAGEEGEIIAVDAKHIVVLNQKSKKTEYKLINFSRTNSFTTFHQRPVVSVGQKIKKAMSWPTPPQPTKGRWLWDKTFWSPFFPGEALIMKMPS